MPSVTEFHCAMNVVYLQLIAEVECHLYTGPSHASLLSTDEQAATEQHQLSCRAALRLSSLLLIFSCIQPTKIKSLSQHLVKSLYHNIWSFRLSIGHLGHFGLWCLICLPYPSPPRSIDFMYFTPIQQKECWASVM